MSSLMILCGLISLVTMLVVLAPFFLGAGGSLQDAAATDSAQDLDARLTAILRRWLKDEEAARQGEISPTEWKQRQRYLTSRYVDCARRLAWLRGVVAVMVLCGCCLLGASDDAFAQIGMAPKQLLVIKPGIDMIHGTWVGAVINKSQKPERFLVPVLMPAEARDFQPIEGVQREDVKIQDDGLWVEKEFPPGVHVVSFAFVVGASFGSSGLSLIPRGDLGELTVMTPRGMLEITGRDFSGAAQDVQDMERYDVLTSTRMILKGDDVRLTIAGVPEGRGRLWSVGLAFALVLIGLAGVLTWRSRSQPSNAEMAI